jgi:hypothetical protein
MADESAVAVVDVPATGPSDFNSSIDAAFASVPVVVETAPDTAIVPAGDASTIVPADTQDLAEPVSAADGTPSSDGATITLRAKKAKQLFAANDLVKALQELFPGVTIKDCEAGGRIEAALSKANAADLLITSYLAVPTQDQVTASKTLDDIVLATFLQQNNPKAFGFLAIRAALKLAAVEPDAFNFLRSNFNARLIEGLKERARQTTDEKLREQRVYLIQRLQMELTSADGKGRHEPTDEILKGITVDPVAQERQSIQAREAAVAAREAADRAANKIAWDNWIDSAENQGWQEEVAAMVNSVRPSYEKLPDGAATLGLIEQELVKSIRDAEDANPVWKEQRDGLRREADLLRTPESIAAVAAYRRSIAKQVLAENARAILNRRGVAVVKQATAANDRARTSAPNELPANGIAPSAANGIDAKAAIMKNAKTFGEAFKDW